MRSRLSKLVAAFIVLLAAAVIFIFANLGYWLMLNEPLRHAQAIAVLGGGQPWRSIEAASLYKAGWAPEIWLTIGAPGDDDAELIALGIQSPPESMISRRVLWKLGVPDAAIRDIPTPVKNTEKELRVIAAFAPRNSAPIILVTSKVHTRRVRAIWNALVPNQTSIVRYKPSDPYDPARWWHTTTDAFAAFKEGFGILNVWAGFPISPRER